MKISSKVIVTIEVQASSNWDTSMSAQDIFDKAKELAVHTLKQRLSQQDMKIVDEPKVIAIMAAD